MLGLKRGGVALAPHEEAWKAEAARTVELLRKLLGASAAGAEHVGSTAVREIEAKPIIDIAVAARSLEEITSKAALLGRYGFIFRGEDVPGQLLFVIEDEARGVVTHHIHIVEAGGAAWRDYIGLRDYLKIYLESEPRPVLTLASMKTMEEHLPSPRFMRVHRSFIVQMDKVRTMDKGQIVFGKTRIPVSDTYKADIAAYFDKYTL